MMELRQVIERHELGRAMIPERNTRGLVDGERSWLICRDCYRRGLLGGLRDWEDYSRHLAQMIEEARA